MPSWLTILCALLAIHLFALEALADRAKRTGETTLVSCASRTENPTRYRDNWHGVWRGGCSLVQRTQTRLVGVRLVARLGNFLCLTVASGFGSLKVWNL